MDRLAQRRVDGADVTGLRFTRHGMSTKVNETAATVMRILAKAVIAYTQIKATKRR